MAENSKAVSKEEELKKLSKVNMIRSLLPIIGLVAVFVIFNVLTKGGMWSARKLIMNQIYVVMIAAAGRYCGRRLHRRSQRILLCEQEDQILHRYDLYDVPVPRIHQVHGFQLPGGGEHGGL